MLMFFSMTTVSTAILLLIHRHRIGMALGRFTWTGMAIFLFLVGLTDLLKVMIVWHPADDVIVALEAFTAVLGVFGAIRLFSQARHAQHIPATELDLRFRAYNDPPHTRLARMRETAAILRGEPIGPPA